jgi:hypothetical protein
VDHVPHVTNMLPVVADQSLSDSQPSTMTHFPISFDSYHNVTHMTRVITILGNILKKIIFLLLFSLTPSHIHLCIQLTPESL